MTDERRWKVGELAQATRVTVRTLHHYDTLGLLVPSARSSAGYRLYDDGDVDRLYRIRALQGLGLSLGEIAAVLDGLPLAAVVDRQLAHVEAQLTQLRRLRGRLTHLRTAASVDELIETMEALEMHEKYFTRHNSTRSRPAPTAPRRDEVDVRGRGPGGGTHARVRPGARRIHERGTPSGLAEGATR